eukprot:14225151-Heterocapsa_arctica.AAC.1
MLRHVAQGILHKVKWAMELVEEDKFQDPTDPAELDQRREAQRDAERASGGSPSAEKLNEMSSEPVEPAQISAEPKSELPSEAT